MRFLILAFSLSASAALAQQTSGFQITIPNQTGDTLTLGGPNVDCGQQRTVNWSLTTSSPVCGDLNVWLTSAASCPDAPAATDELIIQTVSQTDLATTRQGSPDFTLGELSTVGTDVACGGDARRTEYRLCGSLKVGGGTFFDCTTPAVLKANTVKVVYDTEPPGVPVLEAVVPLDSALNVRVGEGGGDPDRFRVRVTRVNDNTEVASLTQSVDRNQFRVERLENGVTYRVEAFALDRVDNESAATEAQEGTPIPTVGFYGRYVAAGGDETGGCNATGGGLAGGAMLAALGFWLSSRRNRS